MAPAELARQVDAADWGKLQEARLVAPETATEAYEEIVRGKVDPALFEYASGNTFRGRVFPIQPKGYNRVILAYEETLPVSDGKMFYRYDLPELQAARDALHAARSTRARARTLPSLPKEARKESGDERDHLQPHLERHDAQGRGALLHDARRTPAVQATSGRHGDKGPAYLYARLRPELPKVEKEKPFGKPRRLPARHQSERIAGPVRRVDETPESDPRRG